MKFTSTLGQTVALIARVSAVCLAMLCAPVWAASADIANTPQASSKVAAKPNFMFILDDSGSMEREYMPDDMTATGSYGYRSSQCNGLAFDPTQQYLPPVRADGSSYPNASFTAAWVNGYNTAAGVTNLTGQVYYRYNRTATSPAPLAWTYTTAGVITSTTFYQECMSAVGDSPGRNVFTSVAITDADTQRKYANWYAYYRARFLLMRTAAGLAFKDVTSTIRIGFTTISEAGVSGTKFLDIADFDTAHKANFYNRLYSAAPSGSTPLRAAVSKVGRYFARGITGQAVDPVQHACQRNYALLSTDGYWNTALETATYGPYRLDGSTAVGQQDGTAARPIYDGASAATVRTTVYQRYQWVIGSRTGRNGCSNSQYPITVQRQTRTDTVTTVNGRATTAGGAWVAAGSSSQVCFTTAQLTAAGVNRGSTVYSTGATTFAAASASGALVSDTTTETSSGGALSSLADVAQYYYNTDLRPELENIVPISGRDTAQHQHMTLFSLGLGVNGLLSYDPNYLSPTTTSDYPRLVSGAVNWPIPAGTTGGSANATHVDDLWHAAVNGRGQYYSARNSNSLIASLQDLVDKLVPQAGSAAAAAASALRPVEGNNSVFLPTYDREDGWHGDLKAFSFKINDVTKEITAPDVNRDTPAWSAGALLDARTVARKILFNGSGGTLTEFTYANLTAAGRNSHFDNRCTTAAGVLSQCPDLDATTIRPKVTGDNLVKFLRGDGSLEMDGNVVADRVFRARRYLLGDLMNASPAYVGASPLAYNDAGHAAHVSATRTRKKAIYAGANDGMLHAFDATTGQELWAFIPTAVMPDLWRLADARYDDNHRYYVDGSPSVNDVYDGARWRTVLIGGLGGGGRGYYALDITDPDAPSLLWEFTDANMGLTFGNPVVTKDATGLWIAAFTSGYNNNVGTADGVGRLYIVNAITGALIRTLSTGVGSTGTPSNLGKIDAWLDNSRNNTALRFYGGDMLGNLWRFDHDDRYLPAGREATLLGQARSPSNAIQPITTKPLIVATKLGGAIVPLVSVATGRYLGATDFADTTTQSIYTVKDSLTATGLGVIRSNSGMVKQTLGATRSVTTPATVDWATRSGWYIDLDQSTKEKVHVDGVALFDSIAYASFVPTGEACSPDGRSYIYQLSVANGNTVRSTISLVGVVVGLGAVVGGDGAISIVSTTTANQTSELKTHGAGRADPGESATVRRSSWRELID
jgi:type IV pilus assembly protein PilY1